MKENQFDSNLWKNLLKLEQDFLKQKQNLTVSYISIHFGIANRLAQGYWFALRNRNNFTNTLKDSLKIRALSSRVSVAEHNFSAIAKELSLSEARLNFVFGLNEDPENWKPIIVKANASLKEEVTAITVLSDIHAEERVEKETVNGLNEYNPDICKQRVERYFHRLLYLVRLFRRGGMKIEHIVLAWLGDMITGYIHEEYLEGNFLSPTEAVNFVEELLVRGLKTIAEDGDFKSIKIVTARGNHSRTTRRKRFATGYKNSYEQLMYWNIQKIFKEYLSGYDNIEFHIPKSEFVLFEVYGRMNRGSHGDHWNYRGGIGGIEIPLKTWLSRNKLPMQIDMNWFGHWHTNLSGREFRINSSVIGYNTFSMGHGFPFEPPTQQLQLLDKKRGYTLNDPIHLGNF